MLRELSIRNILLIEALDLEFQPGLNVLTGETGAGKSILLDALGLVLGWRGRADVVRSGASEGEVTAVFDLAPTHPAHAVLQEAGMPDDEELVLRRLSSPDGRKRGFVNDRRASGDVLRALSDTLVELHGQHDDKGLLDPRGHRALLDAFGGLETKRDKTRQSWRQLREARDRLTQEKTALDAAARDADYLRHSAKELSELDPQPGEDGALDTRRRLMQGAEKMREEMASAEAAMGGEGAEGRLADALRWLELVDGRAEGRLTPAIDAAGRALNELAEAQSELVRFADEMAFDPHELEAAEERLFAIRALARKHNVQPDELPALGQEFQARVKKIDAGADNIAALKSAVQAATEHYDKAADALGAARRKAANRLDKAMAAELAPLKLERAVFETAIEAVEPGPDGAELVAFTVATNPGAPSGPINRIASGGELSRFLLALKVCLTRRSEGLTMIFDEIDRGVGGATADAVGRRLAQVAEAAQVLVVTHSPQVAALGGHHWQVAKSVKGQVTSTLVEPLTAETRIDEIARMLAGDKITDEARSAARALLAG